MCSGSQKGFFGRLSVGSPSRSRELSPSQLTAPAMDAAAPTAEPATAEMATLASAAATPAQEEPGEQPAAPAEAAASPSASTEPEVVFTIVWGKTSTAVSRPAASTVAELKQNVFERLGIPAANQKLLCGGKALKDDAATLGTLSLHGKKVMLLGSRWARKTSRVLTHHNL